MIRLSDISKAIDIHLFSSDAGISADQKILQKEVIDQVMRKRKGPKRSEGKSEEKDYRISVNDSINLSTINLDNVSSSSHPLPRRGLNRRGSANALDASLISSQIMNQASNSFQQIKTALSESKPNLSTSNDPSDDNSMPKVMISYETYIPKLKLDCPDNVIGWTYMRLVLNVFGLRFRFRLQAYATLVISLFLVIVAVTFVNLFTVSNTDMLMNSIYFRQSMLAVLLMFVYLFILVYIGMNVNASLQDHVITLGAQKIRNQLKANDLREHIDLLKLKQNDELDGRKNVSMAHGCVDEEKMRNLQTKTLSETIKLLDIELVALIEANEALDRCVETIKVSNTNDPFTIFGIPAQTALLTSLGSLAVTFYLTLLWFHDRQLATSIYNASTSI